MSKSTQKSIIIYVKMAGSKTKSKIKLKKQSDNVENILYKKKNEFSGNSE